jgi:hypothetical protein
MCFNRDGGKHGLYMGGRHSGGGSSNSSHGNGESYDDNFPELSAAKFGRMRLDNNSPTNEGY